MCELLIIKPYSLQPKFALSTQIYYKESYKFIICLRLLYVITKLLQIRKYANIYVNNL